MALPKTLKYLLCYLPFILVGTGLVVFGVFQQDSARIASLIVGVVVLFSGLFAWCTDTDVGCFVVCSCWSNKDRKLKVKKNSKSTGGVDVENDIFTIHTNKGATTSPQTTASKKTKTAVNNNDDQTTTTGGKDEYKDNKMIQRDRRNNYGQYSLYQQKQDEENYGNGNGTMERNGRKPRFPTRAPSLDNYINGYKPNGIHGRQEMRLTVRNLQKLDKIRQHHPSPDSEPPQMYPQQPTNNQQAMNNESFEIEFSLSIQKRESIKNWITDVHHSRENVSMVPDPQQQPGGPQTWIPHQKAFDSNKIQRKPLPREPSNDRYSSTASGSAIDIEVHSLPRSFGSDGNKSPTGTLDRIDSPDMNQSPPQQEFELSGYIVSEDSQERPGQPATILEAVINDQYV